MEMGLGAGEIACRLGRHRGTIYREIARNRCVDQYRPASADRMAWVRKLRGSRIARSTRLNDYVGDLLAMGWSPEQIAGRMELDKMSTPSAPSPSTGTSIAPPGGVPDCRVISPSARRSGGGDDEMGGENHQSRTVFASISGPPRLTLAAALDIGREISCTSVGRATSS
jgi:Helix-turn-helix domain